ncbi:MAG: hypothetical protein ACREAU_07195 [Nitrosopumilaceae archaeon]
MFFTQDEFLIMHPYPGIEYASIDTLGRFITTIFVGTVILISAGVLFFLDRKKIR